MSTTMVVLAVCGASLAYLFIGGVVAAHWQEENGNGSLWELTLILWPLMLWVPLGAWTYSGLKSWRNARKLPKAVVR